LTDAGSQLGQLAHLGSATYALSDSNPILQPDDMTIRQLVKMALRSQRKFLFYGATAIDIKEAIHQQTGREIERSSLSPTLSRMRDEGILKLSHDGKWMFANDYEEKRDA
jgi:hypothetical protein